MLCNLSVLIVLVVWVFRIEMAGRGRDDAAIAEALGMLAGVLGGNPNVVGLGAARQLSEFQKNNPPMFKGAYDPDGAQKWLKEIERIFRVTECADNQKVRFDTHMLSEEADDWWVATRTELEATGDAEITWAVFRERFLRKYFPEDVRGKKEIEFLELKQGNRSVTEYAAKFTELSKYYTPYNEAAGEFSKCVKFENGLRPEIKQAIGILAD